MPQIVKLTRDMRPWRAGEDAVVPDALATKLVATGDASDPRPYPPPDVAPSVPVGRPAMAAATAAAPARRMKEKRRG